MATNGEEGISHFKKGNFDLVITDLGMPGMSGWQVAKAIKEMDPQTPVILLTGWGTQFGADRVKQSGVDLIMNKPYRINETLNIVQRVLKSKKILSN